MGCTFFWVKFGNAFACFVVSCLLSRWHYNSIQVSKQSIFDYKSKLCLIGKENIFLDKKNYYLQGILNDFNEQDTSSLDYKHKHMMKIGAPPNKFSHALSVTYRIPWFHRQN